MKPIRIGTRDSKLALIQAEMVRQAIIKQNPKQEVELAPMKTTGDKTLDRSLDLAGGKGLFVKELEEALRNGSVDLCVHSLKDMETAISPDLPFVAYGKREDPRDVLILPENPAADGGSRLPLGTSSARRRLQARLLFPLWPAETIRGNVPTRLQKLDRGEYGGLILALAGIRRLGLENRVSRYFTIAEILPAAGQGIIVVQGCKGGIGRETLALFHSRESEWMAEGERLFVQALGCGCGAPAAVLGSIKGTRMDLKGLYYDVEKRKIYRGQVQGLVRDRIALAEQLAKEMNGEPFEIDLAHDEGEIKG